MLIHMGLLEITRCRAISAVMVMRSGLAAAWGLPLQARRPDPGRVPLAHKVVDAELMMTTILQRAENSESDREIVKSTKKKHRHPPACQQNGVPVRCELKTDPGQRRRNFKDAGVDYSTPISG